MGSSAEHWDFSVIEDTVEIPGCHTDTTDWGSGRSHMVGSSGFDTDCYLDLGRGLIAE